MTNVDLSDLQEGWDEFAGRDPLQTGSLCSLDDIGNSQRFQHYHGENLRYVAEGREKGYWRVWGGMCWRDAHEGEMLNYAVTTADNIMLEVETVPEQNREAHEKHANRTRNMGMLRNMLVVATHAESTWVAPGAFDNERYLFNTLSGTLDFSPGNFACRPPSRTDMLTKLCLTPYKEDAKSPLLDAFLDKFLPDPIERGYILTALAIAVLVGGNSKRSLLMLLGPTTTGKSALMSLVTETIGRDYVSPIQASVFRGNLDDKPRPDVIRALSSRLVVASEGSDSWELHADQVKRITGDDKITARGMASNVMREITPLFTPIITSNKTPKIKGADDAIRRRLRVMLMDKQIPPDQDTGIEREMLINNLPARMALLALLVRHYLDAKGEMPDLIPTRFAEATMEVFSELDDIDFVLKDLIETKALVKSDVEIPLTSCIVTGDLYRLYRQRSEKHGGHLRDMPGIKQFTQRLMSLGYEIGRSNGTRIRRLHVGETTWADIMP